MHSRPLVLGHRGASAAAPENTLAAFALAREMGADGVELDVHRTADDVLVVHHDATIEGFGLLRDEPFAALRATRPDVPTLAEALDGCAGLLVNVEIKCCPWDPDADSPEHDVVRACVDTMRAHDVEVIVSSFDLTAMDACREFAPELVTAWLTHSNPIREAAARTARHGHRWLNPDRRSALAATADDVAAIHDLGLSVSVWTVDDPDEMRALADAGVDAIITNVPDVALALLR